jgi:phage terminase large subunit
MDIPFSFPVTLTEVFFDYDYKILYGGRSSAKSSTIARALIKKSTEIHDKVIACCRENKVSLRLSTYADIKNVIRQHNLEHLFNIKRENISCIATGTTFEFLGLEKGGVDNLKSTPNLQIVFVEEAEKVTETSWETLIPTLIRNENSELWMAFNPKNAESATYTRFITNQNQLAGRVLAIEQNYPDNPFLSDKALDEINNIKLHDYGRYEHIYLGKVLNMSEDVIFKNHFKIDKIDIDYINMKFRFNQKTIMPLYGIDFGFSQDPTAICEVFILDDNILYINREIYKTQLLPNKIIEEIKSGLPESIKHDFYGDNARPDTIAQLKFDGLNIIGADKGKGSVESGIEWMKSKKIIINPDCVNAIYEFYNYKYKIDKNTSKITTDIIDANNHIIDAIRYACFKQIQAKKGRGFSTIKMQKFLERNYS